MRIAVFGGAFNPVHNGHVELAQRLKKAVKADRVLIMPSYLSPHKSSERLIDYADRLEMCRIAFKGMEGFEVSDIEIKRGGLSYTSDTLEGLKKAYPSDELYFFCGADMFMSIKSWHKPEEIFSLCTVCSVPRGDITKGQMLKKAEEYEKEGAKCLIFDMPGQDVSSTELRLGEKTEYLDEEVKKYILKKGLYNGKILG